MVDILIAGIWVLRKIVVAIFVGDVYGFGVKGSQPQFVVVVVK